MNSQTPRQAGNVAALPILAPKVYALVRMVRPDGVVSHWDALHKGPQRFL